ncbi:MAG: hypothetical protein JRD71_10800 [Deltaproteobacteria bacterium]|nr:hypothetical protein [Deltaproteobacteria bacterium]
MMKKNKLVWTGYVLLIIFFVASCGGTQLRKEQAEASRKLGEAYFQEGNYTYALKALLKAAKRSWYSIQDEGKGGPCDPTF